MKENQGLLPIGKTGSNNFTLEAKEIRDAYRDYFNSPSGSVPWQQDVVTSTTNIFDEQ